MAMTTANDNCKAGNTTTKCTVIKHRQVWRSGHIKLVSRVVFDDGYAVNFMELMSKKEAIKQAITLRASHGLSALIAC